jgi:hypothetical protein
MGLQLVGQEDLLDAVELDEGFAGSRRHKGFSFVRDCFQGLGARELAS